LLGLTGQLQVVPSKVPPDVNVIKCVNVRKVNPVCFARTALLDQQLNVGEGHGIVHLLRNSVVEDLLNKVRLYALLHAEKESLFNIITL
jgi:hypothetical protein